MTDLFMVRFVPGSQQWHIIEVDVDQFLQRAAKSIPNFVEYFDGPGGPYPINVGAERYKVFAKSRVCACCGVIGNRMFLEPIADMENAYHFNLYAETKLDPHAQTHMVMLTRDHIVPLKDGGPDTLDNCQTLCYLCNCFKDVTHINDLDELRKAAHMGYRIGLSSRPVRYANEALRTQLQKLEKASRAIQAIQENLPQVQKVDTCRMMREKVQTLQEQVAALRAEVLAAELTAQTTGIYSGG